MARQINTSFSRYLLTPEEEFNGTLLTTDTVHVIQNHIAEIAESLLSLQMDTANVLAYVASKAELQGQLNALQWLVGLSAENRAELARRAAEDAQQNSSS